MKIGGAKGRKKLTKKKNLEYHYQAPRLIDGKLDKARLNIIDQKQEQKKNQAILNMQKNFRGKKSRKKYDMNSK